MLATFAAACWPLPSVADEFLTDLRLGMLAHNAPVLGPEREHGVDLNAEAIFVSPVADAALAGVGARWRWLLQPAPDVGISANTNGYTSQIYVGLTWTVDLDTRGALWPDHAVFLAIGLGPA